MKQISAAFRFWSASLHVDNLVLLANSFGQALRALMS